MLTPHAKPQNPKPFGLRVEDLGSGLQVGYAEVSGVENDEKLSFQV